MSIKDNITKLTEEDKKNLLQKSTSKLPENPSQKGFSGPQVKSTMFEPSVLLFKFIQRLTGELETSFDGIDVKLEDIQKIINGTIVVGKAKADQNGNIIDETYDKIIQNIGDVPHRILVAQNASSIGGLSGYDDNQLFLILDDGTENHSVKIAQLNSDKTDLNTIFNFTEANPDNFVHKETGAFKVYIIDSQGETRTTSYDTTVSNYSIVMRSATGQVRTADPVIETDAVNKGYAEEFYESQSHAEDTYESKLSAQGKLTEAKAYTDAETLRAQQAEATKENKSNKKTIINDSTADDENYASIKAVRDFVNNSLNNIAAYYITKDADGNAFESVEELESATVFYSGRQVRVPTRNDYCIVRVDEEHEDSTTRYIYQGDQWEFQYVVNEKPLTIAQLQAINSGITAAKVLAYDLHLLDTVRHIQEGERAKWDTVTGKQDRVIYSETEPQNAPDYTLWVKKARTNSVRYTGGNGVNVDDQTLVISIDENVVATVSSLNGHKNNKSNPHEVTKAQVGLGNVTNTGDSATPVQDGITKFTTGGAYTELAKKVDKTTKVNGKPLSTDVTLSKADVGLGNVDNKSEATIKQDLTGRLTSGNNNFVKGGEVYTALGDKVDKVSGKGLSTNDLTNELKETYDNKQAKLYRHLITITARPPLVPNFSIKFIFEIISSVATGYNWTSLPLFSYKHCCYEQNRQGILSAGIGILSITQEEIKILHFDGFKFGDEYGSVTYDTESGSPIITVSDEFETL